MPIKIIKSINQSEGNVLFKCVHSPWMLLNWIIILYIVRKQMHIHQEITVNPYFGWYTPTIPTVFNVWEYEINIIGSVDGCNIIISGSTEYLYISIETLRDYLFVGSDSIFIKSSKIFISWST